MKINNKIFLERCDNKTFFQYLDKTKQPIFFSNPNLFDTLKIKYHLYLIKKGMEVIGVFSILLENEKTCLNNDLIIYNSPLFLNNQLLNVKNENLKFQALSFIAKFISKNYKSISLKLDFTIRDIRPFLWFNYHEGKKYKVKIRYTSLIEITDVKNKQFDTKTFLNMETVRRYTIRQGIKEKGTVNVSDRKDQFLKFYIETMNKQKIYPSERHLKDIEIILDYLKKYNLGQIFDVKKNGKTIYNLVYCWDKNYAYYLFGAGNPDDRTSWKSTLGHWKIFEYLNDRNIKFVDLEGINSPNRGWFKESFGGELEPYYYLNF